MPAKLTTTIPARAEEVSPLVAALRSTSFRDHVSEILLSMGQLSETDIANVALQAKFQEGARWFANELFSRLGEKHKQSPAPPRLIRGI